MSTNQQAGNAVAAQATVVTSGSTDPLSQTIERIQKKKNLIDYIQKHVLVEGVHYGTIPGCGNKRCLFKSGAEQFALYLDLVQKHEQKIVDLPGNHREVFITVSLVHAPTSQFWGEGVGSCSTKESKYAYREGKFCPICKEPTIKRSKKDREGWYCWSKIGGCGEQFKADDSRITGQDGGRVDNPDIADAHYTALAMAAKRAFVAAIRTATGLSEFYNTDDEQYRKLMDSIDIDGTDPDNVNRGKQAANGANQGNQASGAKPPQSIGARAAKMIKQFSDAGKATQKELESYLRKPAELWTAKDIDAIRDTGIRMTKENISFAQATGANTPADPAADAAQLADLQLETSNLCLRFSNKTQTENILSDNGIMDHQAIAECKSVPTLQRAISALQAALPPDGDDQLFGSGQQVGTKTGGSHGAFA